MRRPTISDRAILELLDALYGAASDPSRWVGFLEQIAGVLGGNAASLHHQHLGSLASDVGETWNMDPQLLALYPDYYSHRNVWFTTRPEDIQEGRVYPDEALCPHDVLDRSEFCND